MYCDIFCLTSFIFIPWEQQNNIVNVLKADCSVAAGVTFQQATVFTGDF